MACFHDNEIKLIYFKQLSKRGDVKKSIDNRFCFQDYCRQSGDVWDASAMELQAGNTGVFAFDRFQERWPWSVALAGVI
ncbi:MAG TPA: hypothetical protein DEB17_05215 [Chlorobaculum sp.]|jgi:hypothetical protein|uniref:Uncharacterized protein n=1 Tax=Chlorobaculum tepidum (strain ATCC 49652 / DSM 12025 / NBRC 103806 / TLS) TaxID=194439 RepID=Q8KAU8_CHLTE|nr:hypothetical protein CT2053 [Chlorobaculum tepidum TLS]HBU23384.1 hypothetical protein [Chlorobaculum sp.]